jgi:hypothetical protein
MHLSPEGHLVLKLVTVAVAVCCVAADEEYTGESTDNGTVQIPLMQSTRMNAWQWIAFCVQVTIPLTDLAFIALHSV